MAALLLLLLLAVVVACTAYTTSNRYVFVTRAPSSSSTVRYGLPPSDDVDPNFEAHLAGFLKKGISGDRPTPDLGLELRRKYGKIEIVKRKAASILKTNNPELALELEELADELKETHEQFVQVALHYDAWSRPDPDLPGKLRAKFAPTIDPNYEENLKKFMLKGSSGDRPMPELPTQLRLMKYGNIAKVKRIAAKELRQTNNLELAAELEEIADELEESHAKFEQLAETFNAMKQYEANKEARKKV